MTTPKKDTNKSNYKITTIVYKQIGRNLNVKIRKNLLTKVGTTEELLPLKELINKYNNTKSPLVAEKLENKILELLTSTKTKEDNKEKIEKSIVKSKLKKATKDLKETEKANDNPVKLLRKSLPKNIFKVSDEGEVIKVGTETVMPQLLVDKILKFIEKNQPLAPLLNFWNLTLINPNYSVIPKLFDYISKHNLIITPSGCFVTYRMVKDTGRFTEDNKKIYTSAHTGEEEYIIGEIFKLDRKECDDNGARDCSKGLHTGSADFIGIKLGNGYDKGEIKTKSQGGGYGTGYAAPDEIVPQKFDNTFGNVAVICIVNPMNVVSVPDSDTRKMRSCELYFAKVTTAEEVLHHLTNEDYLIFDTEYAAKQVSDLEVQLAELEVKNKKGKLLNLFKSNKDKDKAKLEAKKEQLKQDIEALKERYNNLNKNVISEDALTVLKQRLINI